jgi:GTP 3',8-cyclase
MDEEVLLDKFKIDKHKLDFHAERVNKWLKSGGEWEKAKDIYPIYVEATPTGGCNHRCTFCSVAFTGYDSKNRLNKDIFSERLDEMGSLGIKSIMYAGEGEPLLHRGIINLTNKAKQAGMDVAFTSNGVLMDQKFVEGCLNNIEWFKASINAGNAETYARIHQTKEGDFEKVMKNLRFASEYKKRHNLKTIIGAQVVPLPEIDGSPGNSHTIEDLVIKARDELEIDYVVIKPYTIAPKNDPLGYDRMNYNPILNQMIELAEKHSNKEFNVIARVDPTENLMLGEIAYSKCLATPFFWAYIMGNGDVYSCSTYMLDKKFNLGNIHKNTFKEIWEGEKRKENLEYVLNNLDISECKLTCRMDRVNKYLHNLNPEKPVRQPDTTTPHVNFI